MFEVLEHLPNPSNLFVHNKFHAHTNTNTSIFFNAGNNDGNCTKNYYVPCHLWCGDITVKPVLSGHSKRRPKISFQDRLSLNAGQRYCRMLQGEHSAILSTFIKLPFVIIFEWPLKTGFTVLIITTLDFLVWFESLRPINNLSVIKGQVFLGWTSTKLGLMFMLKDTTQWRQWGSNPRPLRLMSSTLPLRHCTPLQHLMFEIFCRI